MGHYCRVCDRVRANERFSGKGHKNHICKECSKLPVIERNEMTIINQIYSLYRFDNLSKVNRRMLEKYLKHDSEKIRNASDEVLKIYTRLKYNNFFVLDVDECTDKDFDEDSWPVETNDEDNYLYDEDIDDLPF